MRWTAEKRAELKSLAPTGIGGQAIAQKMGVPYRDLIRAASRAQISIKRVPTGAPTFDKRALRPQRSEDDAIRARWAAFLPELKANLRADIDGMS